MFGLGGLTEYLSRDLEDRRADCGSPVRGASPTTFPLNVLHLQPALLRDFNSTAVSGNGSASLHSFVPLDALSALFHAGVQPFQYGH